MTIPSVAIRTERAVYCESAPFHPSDAYPEARFPQRSPEPNAPYAMLRQLFRDMGLDRQHYGAADWNPLGGIVAPGHTVVIKPNFVRHGNERGVDPFAVITHPSILRAIADYVFIALRGEGRIVIADAPQMNCDWNELMRLQRLDAIQEFYSRQFGFPVELYDLRSCGLTDCAQPSYPSNRVKLPGDPLGSQVINLGKDSLFAGLPSHNYYGADHDRTETIKHHQGATHEYLVSRTVLAADSLISVPKLKVHKKVGVTLNCKGLVGINTDKNYLIHYRVGTPRMGGDQLPDQTADADKFLIGLQRWCYDHLLARKTRTGEQVYRAALGGYRKLIKPIRHVRRNSILRDSGNWHGNDSAWRMTADLIRIAFYADKQGRLRDSPQRRMFSVVDGIMGGELEGPLAPTPVASGALLAGEDFVSVDLAATRLMGFDPTRLKQFAPAFAADPSLRCDPLQFTVSVNGRTVSGAELLSPDWESPLAAFRPHPGWTGTIEVPPARKAAA